jgi:hypothetical protein
MTVDLNHSLDQLSSWLEYTALSQVIKSIGWIVPVVQTIHILSIAVVIGSALAINLRLMGVLGNDQSLGRVSQRFLPFIWSALLVLLITGAILAIGEPERSLKNPAFQLKLGLIVAAVIVTGLCQMLMKRSGTIADAPRGYGRVAAFIAIPSMLLWGAIIFAGRWIAYL